MYNLYAWPKKELAPLLNTGYICSPIMKVSKCLILNMTATIPKWNMRSQEMKLNTIINKNNVEEGIGIKWLQLSILPSSDQASSLT